MSAREPGDKTEKRELEDLVRIMARLRAPDGCPWDREQDHHSLKSFLIEEAYEVLDAIESGDKRAHCEELGDVLFQIVFQCQVAEEKGQFDIHDVIDAIATKIVRRHPHVFGSESASTAEEVITKWERIKSEERSEKTPGEARSALDGLPQALPALLAAHRLSERAARVGFDWQSPDQVQAKVEEEFDELRRAREASDADAIAWELGDLLFAISNLARHLGTCAEDLLRSANQRFADRFKLVEKYAAERGIDLERADIELLESLWQEAKQHAKQ